MKRKNFFVTLMMGAALIAGLASCNKDSDHAGGVDDGATGAVKITLGFDKAPARMLRNRQPNRARLGHPTSIVWPSSSWTAA